MNSYRYIDRSKLQFDFAVRSRQPEYYDEEIRSLGGRLFYLPWKSDSPRSIFSYVRDFEVVVREEGPFAGLHSHVGVFSGHVLPIGKEAGIPLRIAHSHSASLDKSSVLRRIWATIMRRRIRASATHMLACSRTAAEWLFGSQWQQDHRSLLLPNGIDIAPYNGIHDDRSLSRQKLGLPLGGPLIGHIGRFEPVKNHAFLIDVFAAFLAVCPTAKLLLIGQGALQSQIQHEVAERGIENAVYFLGLRSDIPQILRSVDLFVLPSLHEGLGIVLIEAQAAGVLSLVSDVVPAEVDLGVGLIQFINLSVGIDEWVQGLVKLSARKAPDWPERKRALKRAGYDIYDTVQSLQDLYLSSNVF